MTPTRTVDQVNRLMEAYRTTGDRRARNDIVELHLDVADHCVRRHVRKGVPADDLRQVALLAMVRAVDRFDPDQGVTFATFAGRTMEGELKRHFRDRTWMVRPPRPAQELHLKLRGAENDLTQQLGRAPTVAQLAEHLDESVDHVLEAMEVRSGYSPASLDRPLDHEDGGTLADLVLSHVDRGFDAVDLRALIDDILDTLDERDRLIVTLRFFDNLPQDEIARRVGVSQSYLSRILRRILDDLRDRLDVTSAAG